MKICSVRTLLAFVLAVAFFLPEASVAQAASWHSPAGHVAWTIDPICRDGVRIIMRHILTNPADWDMSKSESQAFAANWVMTGLKPTEPLKLSGAPFLGPTGGQLIYGQVIVTIKRHQKPLRWTTDSAYQGESYVYGTARMKWNLQAATQLPLGTPVVVKYANTSGSFDYFLGAVTDCRLF